MKGWLLGLVIAMGCGVGARAQTGRPAVYLNHLYVVLDSATYRAMVEDAFLRGRFAPSVVRTTARADTTYTGLYFFGRHTYLELFDVANSPSGLADSGLAFGVEEPGGLASVQAESHGALGPPRAVRRPYEGRQIPWFTTTSVADAKPGGPLSLWLMEYDPEYLRQFYPQLGEKGVVTNDITRAGALTRMRQTLPAVAEPVLQDVFEVTVALEPAGMEQLAKMAKLLGLVESHGDGGVTFRGRDFSVVAVPAHHAVRGIRKLRMHASSVAEAEREVVSVRVVCAKDEVDWVWR